MHEATTELLKFYSISSLFRERRIASMNLTKELLIINNTTILVVKKEIMFGYVCCSAVVVSFGYGMVCGVVLRELKNSHSPVRYRVESGLGQSPMEIAAIIYNFKSSVHHNNNFLQKIRESKTSI